ncbi:MAG: TPM domain-containing protein [Leptospiraceae bacterium]|nr:TPM domain-containing protein [Leptospiraceae bacterium]
MRSCSKQKQFYYTRFWIDPLLAAGVLLGMLFVHLLPAQPAAPQRVWDGTGSLQSREIDALVQRLAKLEQDTGAQVSVVLIETTGEQSIAEFSIELAQRWQLGRKQHDDGLLLVVAKKDRKLRIETGYGLEAVITDAVAKRIIDQRIVPAFKRGELYGGIKAGVQQIDALIRAHQAGADKPAVAKKPAPQPAAEHSFWSRIIFNPMVFMFYFFSITWYFSLAAVLFIGFIAAAFKEEYGPWFAAGAYGLKEIYFSVSYGYINVPFLLLMPVIVYFIARVIIPVLRKMPKGGYRSGGSSTSSRSSWSYKPTSSSSSRSSRSWSSSSSSRSTSSSSSSSRSYSGGGGSFGGGGASGSW